MGHPAAVTSANVIAAPKRSVLPGASSLRFTRHIAFGIVLVGAGVDGEGRVELVPGFAVDFESHLFGLAVGIEAEHGLGSADFYRDDVPDVERDDVGGDEVDVALGIDGAALAHGISGAGFVGAGADRVRALDLDAEEVDFGLGTVVEDEVVAFAVSPGLADGEAALAGLVKEGGFGTLSGALGVGAERVAGRGGFSIGGFAIGGLIVERPGIS